MSKKDGGPAFSRPGADWSEGGGVGSYNNATRGMSLRDYFAGQSIAGIIGAMIKPDYVNGRPSEASIASWAYEFADEMLKAREETDE